VSDIAAGVLPAGTCKTQFFFLSHLSMLHTITWKMVNVFSKIHIADSTLRCSDPTIFSQIGCCHPVLQLGKDEIYLFPASKSPAKTGNTDSKEVNMPGNNYESTKNC
jgi:hypothetical protein